MGKINLQKVVIGGLVAGVVLNIVDFVLYGVLLKDQMAAAMTALGKTPMTNAQLPWLNFVAIETIKAFSPKVKGVTASHRNYVFFDKAFIEK